MSEVPDMLPTEGVRPYTYDFIPQLKDLMPTTAGVPGVTYLQVVTGKHERFAQDDGWGDISGGSRIYTITGPEGSADMRLMCKGAPIIGGDPKSGARECMVDAKVEELTGLHVNGLPKELPTTANTAGTHTLSPEGPVVELDNPAEKSTPKPKGDTEK